MLVKRFAIGEFDYLGSVMTQEAAESPHAPGGQEFVIILATRVVLLVASVVHQSLLAYLLLPEGRGAYAISVLLGSVFGLGFSPGVGRGTQYFVMTQQMSVSQGVATALTISVAGSGLAVAVAIPLIHSGLSLFEKAAPHVFYLALALVPLISLSTATALQLEGLQRFARMAAFLSMQSIVAVLVCGVLVWGLDCGVSGALIAVAVSNLSFAAACMLDLRRHCGLVLELPTRSSLTCVLGYGLRHHISQIGSLVEDRLGSLLLSLTASRADIGFFSAGSAMLTRFYALPSSIAITLQPHIARDEAGQLELTAFCARVAWWTSGSALSVLVLVGEPVVRLLFSEAFLPVVPLIWIMAMGVCVYSGADIFMAYFRGVDRPEICSWATCLGMGANVVVFFSLFRAMGVEAAAWGMTVGLVARSAFLLLVYCRISRKTLLSTCMLRLDDVTYVWNEGRLLLKRNLLG